MDKFIKIIEPDKPVTNGDWFIVLWRVVTVIALVISYVLLVLFLILLAGG